MFDVGFWEVSLIAIVALVIVGPERLPGLARTVGLYVGKARRVLRDVRSEIDREISRAELSEIKDIKDSVTESVTEAKSQIDKATADVSKTLNENVMADDSTGDDKVTGSDSDDPDRLGSGVDEPEKTIHIPHSSAELPSTSENESDDSVSATPVRTESGTASMSGAAATAAKGTATAAKGTATAAKGTATATKSAAAKATTATAAGAAVVTGNSLVDSPDSDIDYDLSTDSGSLPIPPDDDVDEY